MAITRPSVHYLEGDNQYGGECSILPSPVPKREHGAAWCAVCGVEYVGSRRRRQLRFEGHTVPG